MRMGTAIGLWGVWKGGPFREGSMRIHAHGQSARPSCRSSGAKSSKKLASELPSRNDLQCPEVEANTKAFLRSDSTRLA